MKNLITEKNKELTKQNYPDFVVLDDSIEQSATCEIDCVCHMCCELPDDWN
jgi:hypothetical protein